MIVHQIYPLSPKRITLHTPIYLSYISAGFPSPAEPHLDKTLDLHELMVENPAATFFVRVSGDSMINAGIQSNDILVVDRSKEAQHNDIVVAIIFGEFTVKRWIKEKYRAFLQAENPLYDPIEITKDSDFEIWGVVTYAIHTLHPISV
ncbi:MAG: peptidase S24 [Deltaproteobacteria bacterium]|nr:peptidase S24 [Deltaproteobacteria bacterium]